MNTLQKTLVTAVASLGIATAAVAASEGAAGPAGGGCHWGAHGAHGAQSAEHAAKRQAALHDKLNLTPAQEAAWKTFTERLQATAPVRPATAPAPALTAPERADRAVAFLQAANQNAAARAQAVKELYVVLSPEQQKTFDSAFQRRHHGRG